MKAKEKPIRKLGGTLEVGEREFRAVGYLLRELAVGLDVASEYPHFKKFTRRDYTNTAKNLLKALPD